jgi:endonuclease YncB( thermonuclease family)
MDKKDFIIIFLLVVSGIFYWNLTSPINIDNHFEEHIIIRVLDGDTVEVLGGDRIRFVGINTPETGYPYSSEAKEFLMDRILNQTVSVEVLGKDRYGRLLGYVHFNGELLNEELVREGLAHSFYYDRDDHYKEIMRAEESARKEGKGIWRESINKNCLEVIEFIYLDLKATDIERLNLRNSCNFKLNLVIKDDATHIYEKTIKSELNLTFKDIFNDGGDSLYIWDSWGLIFFERY